MKVKFGIERADNGYLVVDDDDNVYVSLDENFALTIGREIEACISHLLEEHPCKTRVNMTIDFNPIATKIKL